MMASWRAVLPRHTAHQWRLTVSCEDGPCQLFTPRSQGGLQQALRNRDGWRKRLLKVCVSSPPVPIDARQVLLVDGTPPGNDPA
jgi:hypothetical protein